MYGPYRYHGKLGSHEVKIDLSGRDGKLIIDNNTVDNVSIESCTTGYLVAHGLPYGIEASEDPRILALASLESLLLSKRKRD